MPYLQRTVEAGDVLEVKKYYSARWGKRSSRGANIGHTPEEMARINERRAEERLRWLLNANFRGGDLHLTLTYDSLYPAPAPERARHELEGFLRSARQLYRKHGKEMLYVTVTEYLAKRIHHHVILNRIDAAELWPIWEKAEGHGAMRTRYLDKSGQYAELAAYLIKETRRSFREPDAPYRRRWCASRNLVQPKIERKVVPRDRWRETPPKRRGWRLDETRLIKGVDEYSGAPFQEYTLMRLRE